MAQGAKSDPKLVFFKVLLNTAVPIHVAAFAIRQQS